MSQATKSIIQHFFYHAGHSINLDCLIGFSKQQLFLPFYHVVSNQSLTHVKELYRIRDIKTFREDLKFLQTHFTSITIEDLNEQVINKKPFSKPSFHLTFDDGLKEMLTEVAPILKEQGIHATFFINSAFVDNKDLFYRYKVSLLIHYFKHHKPSAETSKEIYSIFANQGILKSNLKENFLAVSYSNKHILDQIAVLVGFDFQDYLKKNEPYLTTEDIHQLKNMGFSIGAHSIDHPEYQYVSLEEQLRQTQKSIDFIKTTFNLPYSYFSFPFSDENVSKAFFEKLYSKENNLVDLSFGISGLKKDSYSQHLHRFPMEGSQLSAKQLIKTEYLYYILKSFIHKNTIARK